MAPERIKNSNSLADEQLILADVYGYGLIMWEIFTDGRRPYEDYDDKEVISFKIQSHSQRLNPLEDIGNLPLDVPRVLRDLVHQCLAPEPSHRPTLAVILESLDFYIDTAPPSSRFYHSGPLHQTTNNSSSLSEDLSGLGTSIEEGEVSQLSGLQQEDFRGGMYYFTKGRYSDAIEYFKKAELQDNSLSQRMLGHCYRAINKDVESFSSFKKAATGGDIKGQFLLAWCYEHQYGTRQHDELAFSLYKISSENGNLEAAIRLCDTKWIKYIYSTIAQDTDESVRKWLNMVFKLVPSNYDALTTKICELAEAGDSDSQYLLAWLYSSALLQKGGEDRADDSFVWLVKSGIGGNQLAQLKFYSRLDPDVYSNNILKSKTPTPDHCAKIFQLLMDAAQAGAAGSSFSQCGVGICFQHGIGTAISTNESFEWYHKAAQAGDAHAQWKLGMIYYQGIDIIQDSKMAFGWLTKAANAGSAGAQNVLGICYELGKGTKVDLQRAFQLYLQAAETGNVEAIYNTGICYANGKGVEKDHSQAFQRFSKAAEAGHVDAICHTGICYANGMGVEKDENQAFQRFSKAAETGNVDAIYNTGISYANGMGVGLDINQAFQRFFKAAEAGCVEAMYTTGDCYANGIGVGKDDEQAFQMFSEAAEAGHVDAMYKIGICYEKGTGTEKDYNQAFRWYFKAVKAGHAIAQVDLGNLYLDGKGTEQDRDAANKWYIEAAMYNLGQSHEFDREQNLAKAKKWFMKGVKRDYKFEQKTPETKICQSCDAGDVDAQRQLIDVRPSFGRLLDFRRLRRVFPIMKGRY
ncbi:hypothetical protein BC938DRAFT_473695 [Jimgerdemannia flammicorona]|uniref:Protein kinase domain-containing protein n=1 Tax=Jimgerdemannia flammicorona TaxID=994334 RepID=A0A433Q3I2_9FUNG|nr:hypothetical protein BC938DRAFT_473695 [Jimgerdemannia flammicorona]